MRTFTALMALVALSSCLLSGCATSVATGSASKPNLPVPWRDDSFAYAPELVRLKQADLFVLPPDLQEKIAGSVQAGSPTSARLKQMMVVLFGKDLLIYPYASGHSTAVAQTWNNKRGDCISITMLAYAVAKEMNIDAQMQEVYTPTLFDRRNHIDFINGHVNLLVKNSTEFEITSKTLSAHDFVIDFEPEQKVFLEGTALSEAAIAARFYNNLGAEYLANNQTALAYAYFKQAVLTDPRFEKSYTNLAQLYKSRQLLADAENMLLYALSIAPKSETTLHSLMELMAEQKRTSEQQYYATLLQESQKNDPYYWLAMGIDQLKQQRYKDAIASLKQAKQMTHGFDEVHANLALAYWRDQQPEKAREELAILAELQPGSQRVSALNAKFQTPAKITDAATAK